MDHCGLVQALNVVSCDNYTADHDVNETSLDEVCGISAISSYEDSVCCRDHTTTIRYT